MLVGSSGSGKTTAWKVLLKVSVSHSSVLLITWWYGISLIIWEFVCEFHSCLIIRREDNVMDIDPAGIGTSRKNGRRGPCD